MYCAAGPLPILNRTKSVSTPEVCDIKYETATFQLGEKAISATRVAADGIRDAPGDHIAKRNVPRSRITFRGTTEGRLDGDELATVRGTRLERPRRCQIKGSGDTSEEAGLVALFLPLPA